ncbi:MAG: phage terminase large subunit family protein [Rhodoferax sp.]|nr:phage terminase large subunit family protein [Rhodoferax sp.]MDP3651058.1 phage terminase large subunit family protein [Rhodoferax sp.]
MQARGLFTHAARAIAPRKPLTVSQWADANRVLSSKASSIPGRWVTDRTPMLREPMDCMSARSPVQEVVCIFPIQFGKSELETNVIGYTMCENPGPIMVVLPGEVSQLKFINQKLNPLLEETEACTSALTSTNSRNSSNTREFKDFAGGQIYIEHAGNAKRLKGTSAKLVIADEFSSFASSLKTGDDPDALLDGRTSAFPSTSKRASVGTPEILGQCRLEAKWENSDQRHYHVPCPHCGHEHPFTWLGFHWALGMDGKVTRAWCVCPECGSEIEEHHKDRMGDRGRWVPTHPTRKIRGYRASFLNYRFGLGPRWLEMAQAWVDAQGDPARLKTFINDRRAEAWEDAAMRNVKHNAIADRAEPYRLRVAPRGVLCVTAGVDTQDNRLAVQLVGWGRNLAFWVLDYVELAGDPANPEVWAALTELLNTPIQSERGGTLRVEAMANDAGGHRTEDVKNFVRSRRVRRPLCIFGAIPNNAPVLSKGKMQEVNWKGQYDKRGVIVHHVGTVAIKHWLYSRLSTDADKTPDLRTTHFTSELPPEYFPGLVSETYNPAQNRFVNRRGARNEPLDTWVYAYAAAHHPELRLHRATKADWDNRELLLTNQTEQSASQNSAPTTTITPAIKEGEKATRKANPAPASPRAFTRAW